MRVISLVPSLTETLIESGVDVVGRTRFCIHPSEKVAAIPKVGGTKGVDWQKCEALKPDIVVFDREENIKDMAAQCPFAWTSTHVESIESCAAEFNKLSIELKSAALGEHSLAWKKVADCRPLNSVDWNKVPGQLKTLNSAVGKISSLEYIIWRDPWMAVGRDTFIASVLAKLGFANLLSERTTKYPELSDSQMGDPETFYLFSSEPYRFLRHEEWLNRQGFSGAIVDGEFYSWFGARSLRALQYHLNLS